MTQKVSLGLAIGVALGALLSATPESWPATQDEPTAGEGWMRVSQTDDANAHAFVLINNPSMYDVYIVSATAPIADSIEFRNKSGGEAQAIREITVPAYGSVEMSPDAIYLELLNLSRQLEPDESIPITLKTDGGVELVVRTVVKDD